MFCIPRAQGVPGYYWNQPPYWLSTGTFPQYTGLDDPRWRGAAKQGFPLLPGTAEDMDFRALYHTVGADTSLYLSWNVKFDPSLNNGNDVLYVGLIPNGGTKALTMKFAPFNTIPGANQEAIQFDAPVIGGTVEVYTKTGAAAWIKEPETSVPDWINDNTHVWMTVSTPNQWAIQMRIPLNSAATDVLDDVGLNLGSDFSMWYVTQIALSGGAFTFHEWLPGQPSTSAADLIVNDNFPDPANWDSFHLSTGPGDPVCPTTGGISITYADMGTSNPVASQILYSNTDPRPTNTFFTRPRNYTPNTINIDDMSARFRIANWGSVADPLVSWEDIPNGTNVSNDASIPPLAPGATPPATNPIHFDWLLNDTDIANLITGKTNHKCILVELSGPGLTFFIDSAYRNMDFVSASTFQREAEINILGLDSMPGGGLGRDVYLAVEEKNMPATIPQDEDPKTPYVHVWPYELEGRIIDYDETYDEAKDYPDKPEPPLAIPAEEAIAMAKNGQLPLERLEQIMPTVRIHVYHDTGERVTIGGREHPVLRAQASYGYFVEHEGELYGWDQSLQGAQQIAPNFYRLSVPDSGVAKVTNTIMAVDKKGCDFLKRIFG